MRHRLALIHDQINRACASVDRDPSSVTLMAVSKTQPCDTIKEAIDLGIIHFGENRVQEAESKWPDLKGGITLHLIGPLQTNKVKHAAHLFDVLHTLDRPALVDEMMRVGWTPPCFVQVNTGEEEQKAGVYPADLNSFIERISFTIHGFMCIPPVGDTPSLHFALLRTLAMRHGLSQLSMGMSSDFEAAIRCGATHIRIGSALFGDRVTP